jgi:DNA-binding transcriptional ArsR family regulator
MKALGDYFGSAAKTEILRALYYQPDGVGLRQLTRIAGLRVRSAELALDSLVNARLVRRRRALRRVFYMMDRDDPRAPVLAEVFDAAAIAAIRAESRFLDKRAKLILPFIRQTTRMLNHARGGQA